MIASVGSNRTVASAVAVGAQPSGIAFSDDGLAGVTNTTDETVTRLDPDTGTVIQTIHGLGPSPTGVAFGDGAVWVADSRRPNRVADSTRQRTRWSSNTRSVMRRAGSRRPMARCGSPIGWTAPSSSSMRIRVRSSRASRSACRRPASRSGPDRSGCPTSTGRPSCGSTRRTGMSTAPSEWATEPRPIAATDKAVWVANRRDDSVSHIDPTTDSVVAHPLRRRAERPGGGI